jgi:type VI protein secretion system component VasF
MGDGSPGDPVALLKPFKGERKMKKEKRFAVMALPLGKKTGFEIARFTSKGAADKYAENAIKKEEYSHCECTYIDEVLSIKRWGHTFWSS